MDDFRLWFFDVTSMSSASGVVTRCLYSSLSSSDEAGGCMKAGLVMSSTMRLQGSSSGKSAVRPRISFSHCGASAGGSPTPALCNAIAPNWTRKACQAWRWCGRSAGNAATSSRISAAYTSGNDAVTREESPGSTRNTGCVRRLNVKRNILYVGMTMAHDYQEIVTVEPGKRGGKPCVRGLRITVYEVLE